MGEREAIAAAIRRLLGIIEDWDNPAVPSGHLVVAVDRLEEMMESILFWVCFCNECLTESITGDGLKDEKVSDNVYHTICPACGKATEHIITIPITWSRLDKLDRDTLTKVKETINGLIEQKTKELNEEG